MSNVIPITKKINEMKGNLKFGDRVRLKYISTELTRRNADLLELGMTYTVLKEFSYKNKRVITLFGVLNNHGVNPKFSLEDFAFVCKGAPAVLKWSLMIKCSKCSADLDLSRFDNPDRITSAIFSSKPEILWGDIVTCPHCNNVFVISDVNF